jgi:hypothetical protein
MNQPVTDVYDELAGARREAQAARKEKQAAWHFIGALMQVVGEVRVPNSLLLHDYELERLDNLDNTITYRSSILDRKDKA